MDQASEMFVMSCAGSTNATASSKADDERVCPARESIVAAAIAPDLISKILVADLPAGLLPSGRQPGWW